MPPRVDESWGVGMLGSICQAPCGVRPAGRQSRRDGLGARAPGVCLPVDKRERTQSSDVPKPSARQNPEGQRG